MLMLSSALVCDEADRLQSENNSRTRKRLAARNPNHIGQLSLQPESPVLFGDSLLLETNRAILANALCSEQSPTTSALVLYSHTGVCEKNTPPEKNECGKTSFQSAKSGAGKQLPLPARTPEGLPKRSVYFADTGTARLGLDTIHARFLPSFQQPTYQAINQSQ